jgi:pimeloyl-ACP methyl ester carboxylesterase
MKSVNRLLIAGLILVLVGCLIAWNVQTDGGKVAIRDLRFNGPGGSVMSALLYVPKTATAKTPAPGILAVHGYINSRETQDGFAIEYARRGYVVLALDQTGHGYSDPPAFANGFGGPAGLAYLRGLDIVDKANIGMEGHSMGGWTILAAAAVMPDGYASIVLEGSSTGAPYAKEGDPTWPRNLGVVFSTMDEFSPLMWGVPRGKDAPMSAKLQKVFGVSGPLEVGKVYGDLAAGTARALYQPKATHPGDHISNEAIGYSIDWFAKTLKGGTALPTSNQVWIWKELGTLVAFVGFVLFVLGFASALLGIPAFAASARAAPAAKPVSGIAWWVSAAISMAVPILSYFWVFKLSAKVFKASWLFPQTITSQIMGWALFNGLVSLVLFLGWHYLSNKKAGGSAVSYGLAEPNGKIACGTVCRDLALASAALAGGCALLLAADYFFKVDFRFWILALKPMSALQFGVFLRYVLPFAAFFLISSVALNGQMRLPKAKVSTRFWANMLVLAGGFAIYLAAQYLPLFAGGTLLTPGEPLNVIVMIQFLPLLTVASIFSTWFFEKTGRVYAGAFANAIFVTWYIVAGQAIQFPIK